MVASEEYLKVLNEVLSNHYMPNEYSLNGYAESALCIEKTPDGQWEVYTGERGVRHHESKFGNILEACLVFLSWMGITKKEIANMREEFLSLTIDNERFKETLRTAS